MSTHLIESTDALPEPDQPLVLAVGAFDGIHRGHQSVLQDALRLAVKHSARVGALRFHPHPQRVLRPDVAPPLLCSEEQISEQLREEGMDLQLRLPFTPDLAERSPEAFLQQLAAELPGLKALVVGENWRFGKGGTGDITLLRREAQAHGWEVHCASISRWQGERISSTRIRAAIRKGSLRAAASMLGRPYRMEGEVRSGKQYGRELGFPTANFIPLQEVMPPQGVYAMRAHLNGSVLHAAGYITQEPNLVEVHLLDFHGDLYGKHLAVDLMDFRRAATPISDPQTLRETISEDVKGIRRFLQQIEGPS